MLDERFAQVRASLDASFARFTLTGVGALAAPFSVGLATNAEQEELPQSTLIGLERVRITNMNAATQSSVYHLFPNLKGVYHPPHLDEQERLPHSFRKGLYIRDATIAAYLAHHAVEASPPHHKHSTRARRFRKFLEGKL
ncbi:hypothetical protein JCM6882_002571 [Rhodosporidiobolus microsporus]